jgi:hypothetical protein
MIAAMKRREFITLLGGAHHLAFAQALLFVSQERRQQIADDRA